MAAATPQDALADYFAVRCACGYDFAAVAVIRKKQHALGFHASELARLEVCNYDNLLTHHFFRREVLCDAADNLTALCTHLNLENKKLVSLRVFLRLLDYAYAEVDFVEVLEFNCRLQVKRNVFRFCVSSWIR